MTVGINFLEEIQTRINAAMVTGQPLASVKSFFVCPDLESRLNNDFPKIILSLEECNLEDVYRRAGETENLVIKIILIGNRLDNLQNGYYKLNDTTTFLYLFFALRDVIQKSTLGAINLDYNNTVSKLVSMNTVFNHLDKKIEAVTTMSINTNLFQVGSR